MKNIRDELKNLKNISDFIHIDDVLELLDQWEKEQDVNIKTVEAYRSGRDSILSDLPTDEEIEDHFNTPNRLHEEIIYNNGKIEGAKWLKSLIESKLKK